MKPGPKHAAILAVLSALAATPGCTCSRGGTPATAGADFGEFAAKDWDAPGELALARAIVEGKGRAAAAPPRADSGRRAFVVAWNGGGDAQVATANAPSLADAVASAAEAVRPKVKDPAKARIEIDVVTEGIEGASAEDDPEIAIADVGLEGVLVTRDDGKTGFVLPGEITERGLFHQGKQTKLEHDKIVRLLADRAGVDLGDLGGMRAYRFHTDARVETAKHDGALRVYRGMVERPDAVTIDNLLAAVRRGADYLARIENDQGRFIYMYHPVDEREDTSYGWLRHAGTIYAMMEAYDELGTPLYAEKAERAIEYMEGHLRKEPAPDDPTGDGAKYLLDTNDEEQQKVGGGGLALLALAKYTAATGKRDHIDTMRALARFIIKQQFDDGHFRMNADVEASVGKKLKKEPVYYPGEAALALMRLYGVDPQPAYLDAARKAADYVVHVRDVNVSLDNQEHDHWMSYTLNDLYRMTKDAAYIEHAYKIARAIQSKQHGADSAAPDWVGTFYEGQTTPASTRVEAYDADIVLSRFAGKPEDWLRGSAMEVARGMLGQQFDEDNDYFLKNPRKADGGVRESLYVQDVRIDYVQHAMSAWLHLARIMRDPAYGKTGAPCQDLPKGLLGAADGGAPR
jgi:hypothetical protein